MKLIQGNIGITLDYTGIGNNSMIGIPIAQQLRERIDKRDCMKLKCFSTAKETVTRLKRQLTEQEKIFASYTSDKGLITRTCREHKKTSLSKNQQPTEFMGK
jgi:hypothetical protein